MCPPYTVFGMLVGLLRGLCRFEPPFSLEAPLWAGEPGTSRGSVADQHHAVPQGTRAPGIFPLPGGAALVVAGRISIRRLVAG